MMIPVRSSFDTGFALVRPSQMTSEVFCGGLSGGVKNTVPAGRICALVLLVAYSYSAMSDTMESGYIKISEPHHLDRLKMLIASVRDGQARSRCRNTSRTRNLRQGKASTTSAILSETAPEETGTCPNAHTAQPKKNPPTPWFPPYDRNYEAHPHLLGGIRWKNSTSILQLI